MTIEEHRVGSRWSRGSRRLAGVAASALLVALPVAGCGSSSNSSSSSAPAVASSSSSASTPASSSGQPLTKAQYEAKLGPLFNDQVDPALKAALSNGGARDPQKLADVIGLLTTAHDAMATVTPPAAVSDLNQQAVTTLGAMVSDITSLRQALVKKDQSAYSSAAQSVVNDAHKIQSIGQAFVSRGY